ncbi:MAG: type II secretion system GspH family protein [Planctomycetaceae bacterium]|nr:type II secretion system GspH family protein [Planctomycetaceae bacterium]
MRKKGFTLIELLVVIAIIALLLSIITPALKKAKSYAKSVIDSTNLRSLSTAMHIYLNSSNDQFFDYGTGVLWMDRIGTIVDNIDDVRFCPQTTSKIEEVKAKFDGTHSVEGQSLRPWLWPRSSDPLKRYEMGSYGLNGWFYADCKNKPASHSCLVCNASAATKSLLYSNRASVKNPSQTPMLLDSSWVDTWPRNTNVVTAPYDYDLDSFRSGNLDSTDMMRRVLIGRHGPQTQVIFLDGQIKTIPHKELWTLAWHRGATPNYNPVIPAPVPTAR